MKLVIKKTKSKEKKKPLTAKRIIKIIGMVVFGGLMLLGIADRIYHYFHYHLK